jgi:hypothetical protein
VRPLEVSFPPGDGLKDLQPPELVSPWVDCALSERVPPVPEKLCVDEAASVEPLDAVLGSLPEPAVPAPDLAVDAVEAERDSLVPILPPAVIGLTWLACMADCKCAVCCWKDAGRAALCDPKKCCEALL